MWCDYLRRGIWVGEGGVGARGYVYSYYYCIYVYYVVNNKTVYTAKISVLYTYDTYMPRNEKDAPDMIQMMRVDTHERDRYMLVYPDMYVYAAVV
jgi:hypothetical protein